VRGRGGAIEVNVEAEETGELTVFYGLTKITIRKSQSSYKPPWRGIYRKRPSKGSREEECRTGGEAKKRIGGGFSIARREKTRRNGKSGGEGKSFT